MVRSSATSRPAGRIGLSPMRECKEPVLLPADFRGLRVCADVLVRSLGLSPFLREKVIARLRQEEKKAR